MKIVIFDMDGTLIDSKKDITISINYVRQLHYGLPPLSENFVVKAINMPVRDLIKMFYETDIYNERDRELFEKHYSMQCIKNPYLYDDIKQTLQNLLASGVKISVATNAPTPFALKMLKYLKIDFMFDIIIGADKVNRPKPDPEMLNEILKYYKFNNSTDEAWMIGDSSVDMLSAKNAGISSMFATWGFTPVSDYETIIRSPKEILDIVL